jgi:hypothetical protein
MFETTTSSAIMMVCNYPNTICMVPKADRHNKQIYNSNSNPYFSSK